MQSEVKNQLVQIPKDNKHRHHVTIPANMWDYLGLQEGDWIDLSISLNRRGNEKPEEKL